MEMNCIINKKTTAKIHLLLPKTQVSYEMKQHNALMIEPLFVKHI